MVSAFPIIQLTTAHTGTKATVTTLTAFKAYYTECTLGILMKRQTLKISLVPRKVMPHHVLESCLETPGSLSVALIIFSDR